MKKNKILVLCASLAATAVAVGAVALMPKSALRVNSLVKYSEKDVTLEFNASNLSSGSGTVTLNGNLFTYENLNVNGNTITLSSGSRIYANQNSGASNGANGLKGSGFSNIKFVGGNGGTAVGEINSDSLNIEVANGGSFVQYIDNNAFDFSITSGSLALSKMELTYSCTYNETPATQKVLFVGSDNMSASSWESTYTEMLNSVESVTAECDHFTTGSFTFLQIGNMETNYANKAQEFRDKLASNSWDAVVFQLSRRLTPSSTELNNEEFEMFRDVIIPVTKTVTNNITLLAMEGTSNPTIFDYNPTDGQPVKTSNSETMTAEENASFLDTTAVNWASATGVKVARYGSMFTYCDGLSAQSNTKSYAKVYSRGLVAYATIDETPIPNNIATNWVSTVFTSTSSSANSIKNGLGAKVNELTFS